MRTNYRRGVEKEYEAKKILEKNGYMVKRMAGSHSPADLIAHDSEGIWFLQCKRLKKAASITPTIEKAMAKFAVDLMPKTVGLAILIYIDRDGWYVENIRGAKGLNGLTLSSSDLRFPSSA